MQEHGRPSRKAFVTSSLLIIFYITLWYLGGLDILASAARNGAHLTTSSSQSRLGRNATLGFEKILAFSRGTSWRIHGLQAAARETGLDIVVPQQPPISDDFVRAFESLGPAGAKKPSHESAIAWLAHLDLLKHIVQSGYETTLIVEDDVDFSVHIKQQMTTLSDKLRAYTETHGSDPTPYGSAWDVLWLGHCGEWYNPQHTPKLSSWPDPTNGRREDWRGVYDRKWLQDLPEGHRSLYWSVSPICTYAYAVSRAGAQKVLAWASGGADEAYDIKLQHGCQSGGLRCISVVDQLFHHYRPPAELGAGSEIGDVRTHHEPLSSEQVEGSMGSTAVILESARCRALFGSTCHDTSTMDQRPFKS